MEVVREAPANAIMADDTCGEPPTTLSLSDDEATTFRQRKFVPIAPGCRTESPDGTGGIAGITRNDVLDAVPKSALEPWISGVPAGGRVKITGRIQQTPAIAGASRAGNHDLKLADCETGSLGL